MAITLGGKTAAELNIRVLKGTQKPIMAATRDRTLIIPGRHGVYDFSADLGAKLFALECAILADSPADLQAKVRALAAHLSDPRGRPRTLELIWDEEPGVYYNVRYSGNLPVERIAALGLFTLPLLAPEPFAFDNAETVFDETMDDEQTLAATGSGNIAALPVVEITALAETTGIILNVGLGEIRYLDTLQTDEVLTVDAATYQASVNGANALDDVDTDWPVLYPGNNTVTYRGSATAQVKITHRGRWA